MSYYSNLHTIYINYIKSYLTIPIYIYVKFLTYKIMTLAKIMALSENTANINGIYVKIKIKKS